MNHPATWQGWNPSTEEGSTTLAILVDLMTRIYALSNLLAVGVSVPKVIKVAAQAITSTSWAVRLEGPTAGLTQVHDTLLGAFGLAVCTYYGLPMVAYQLPAICPQFKEEIFGPSRVELWGVDFHGRRETHGMTRPIIETYGVLPTKRPLCKRNEDHFFATQLGGGLCFLCDRSADEVYNRDGR